jgi:hypothetical protein
LDLLALNLTPRLEKTNRSAPTNYFLVFHRFFLRLENWWRVLPRTSAIAGEITHPAVIVIRGKLGVAPTFFTAAFARPAQR